MLADPRLFEDVPTWLGENSRRTAGVGESSFCCTSYCLRLYNIRPLLFPIIYGHGSLHLFTFRISLM